MADTDTDVKNRQDHETKPKPKLKRPKRYHVVLINDDYTPMDFVVRILMEFFHKDIVEATSIMMEVHQKGEAIAGTYSLEVAETKVVAVIQHSRVHEFPLLAKIVEAA
jgi:ATP-dependent Clp protease adaptor protein ClpS